jgi:iron complex transport system substrate-binding protein
MAALLALAISACSSGAPRGTNSAPQRIVSLLPSFTQIVISLGAGDRIIGRTPYCPREGVSPQAVEVGAALDANYEGIFALRPDLVLVQQAMHMQRQRLEALGLPVLAPPTDTVADAYTAVRAIAARLGLQPAGERLVHQMQAELQSVRDAVRDRAPVRALLVVGHNTGELREIYVAAKGTFLDELLQIAGGVNALAEVATIFPKVGAEEVLRLDPEVILVFAPGQPASSSADQAELDLWRTLPYLRAVRNQRVHRLADLFSLSPGPDMAATARQMAALLHPPAAAAP